MCDFHRLLHLLKLANSSLQLIGTSTILSMKLRGRRALGLRRGDVVGGDVVLLMGVGLDSSIVDDVFSEWSLFMFPFVDVFRSNKTCIVVFQIITLGGFRFFTFQKFIQVVFPSCDWSSRSPLSLCRDGVSWVELSGFSGPSVRALGANLESLAPFQCLFFPQKATLLCSTNDLEFTTLHVCQCGGALISINLSGGKCIVH